MLYNINNMPSAGSISDAYKVIVNGTEYTALQLKNFMGGDTSVFDGTETILKADKNTGRGTQITLNQLKDFVDLSPSPVIATDNFALVISGLYNKVTASLLQTYLYNFSPLSLSGLQVWYDMTDNSTISSSGSSLTQLRDKSGNNNHSNPTAPEQMVIGTNSLTGKQICGPPTTTSSIPLSTPLVGSTFSYFLVMSNFNAGLYSQALMGGSGVNDFIQAGGPGGGYADSIVSGAGGGSQTYQDDFSLKEMTVLCIRQQAGVSQIWEFNGRNRIRTTGSVPSVNWSIGSLCNLNDSLAAGGHFGGFVYYNSFLSDADASKVARYLVNHHNLNPGPYYKIMGFGDSYTVGLGASTLENSYIHKIATSLDKVVSNAGISGTLFQNIGDDAQSGFARYTRDLAEYPYTDRLYILYGFNDVSNMSASVSTYQTQLETMIADLISIGYNPDDIYLGTVPRKYGDADSALVQQYGDAVRTVGNAHGCHVAEIYAAQVANGGDTLFSGDNLHPNDAGHQVIADAFLAA